MAHADLTLLVFLFVALERALALLLARVELLLVEVEAVAVAVVALEEDAGDAVDRPGAGEVRLAPQRLLRVIVLRNRQQLRRVRHGLGTARDRNLGRFLGGRGALRERRRADGGTGDERRGGRQSKGGLTERHWELSLFCAREARDAEM